MKTILIFTLTLLVSTFASAQKLEKVWSTPSELYTCESVLFDQELDIVFVACMGKNRNSKDGDGYIAQMNLKGEITNLNWVTNLNDPKGMAIREGKLYVSDMDELVVIDISSAQIEKKYPAPNAKFLNDVSVSETGLVFVSDTRDQAIYALINGEFNIWLQNINLKSVNGLWCEGDILYAGNKSVWEIDIQSKEMTELFDGTGGIDGLETIGNGNFVFSNWGGKIYVSNNGEVIQLLETKDEDHKTADIDFVPEKSLVLVPTFFNNIVEAYQLAW